MLTELLLFFFFFVVDLTSKESFLKLSSSRREVETKTDLLRSIARIFYYECYVAK